MTVSRLPLASRSWNPDPLVAINSQTWVKRSQHLSVAVSSNRLLKTPVVSRAWINDQFVYVHSQTWVKQRPVGLLIGKDTFFGGAGQGPTYDWPNPRGYISNDLRTWLNAVVRTAVTQLPKNMFDWPLSIAYDRRSRAWPSIEKLTRSESGNNFQPLDRQFRGPGQFTAYDWPNPQIPRRSIDLQTWLEFGNTLPPIPAAAAVPKNMYDWPIPRGPLQGVIDLKTWIDTPQPIETDMLPSFPVTMDLSPPKGRLRSIDLITWVQTPILTAIDMLPAYPVTMDLSVPKGRLRSGDLLTWLETGNAFSVTANPFAQFDWPNPQYRIPVIDLRTWLQVPDLFGQDQFFGDPGQGPTYDWPNPRGYVPASDLRTWIQTTDLQLLHPFAQFDWPVPKAFIPGIILKTWTDTRELVLKDIFFGLAGNPTFDWPVPKGYIQPVKDWIDDFKLSLFGQDKFFGAAGQGPTYDWPNPRGYVPVIDLKTWLQSVNFEELLFPFNLYDWPLPRGPLQGTISLRTFIDPVKLNLRGQDTFFGGAGQGPVYDWPNPRGAASFDLRTWIQGFGQNQSTVVAFPFNEYDWPVPKGSIPGTSLKIWIDTFKLTLIGQDTIFGSPGMGPDYDWPNPRGYLRSIDLLTWLQGFNYFSSITAPFFQTDWPNPRGFIPGTSLKTWIDLTRIQLLVPFTQLDWPIPKSATGVIDLRTWLQTLLPEEFQPPFAQLDWPVPKGASPLLRDWSQRINLYGQDTFFGGAGQGPTYDWPNPRGYVSSIDLRTWIESVQVDLLRPFAQFDWPNPKGFIPGISLKTWIDLSKGHLLVPFNQLDWPIPKGSLQGILKTWIDTYKLTLVGQDTFFGAAGEPIPNYDWPAPRGPFFDISLRKWTPGLSSPIQIQLFPFFQLDWPVPKGAVPGTSLKTWIDVYKLTLIGKDTFFGGAGQGPTYDWPNPRGAQQGDISKITLLKWSTTLVSALSFNQYDWPNPRGPVPGINLKTWIEQTKLNLLQPFFQTDWPIPKGAARGSDWRDAYKLTLIGKDTFFGAQGEPKPNYDWPVPRGPFFDISLRKWTPGLSSPLQIQKFPFKQLDWPVPRGYVPGTSLKTWIDTYKLTLIGKDKFFGAPGQGPRYDWPVPKAPVSYNLRTWLQGFSPALTALTRFPVGQQWLWPNPRGYVRVVDFNAWIHGNLPVYFPPPVVVPTTPFTGIRKPLFTQSGYASPNLWAGRGVKTGAVTIIPIPPTLVNPALIDSSSNIIIDDDGNVLVDLSVIIIQ